MRLKALLALAAVAAAPAPPTMPAALTVALPTAAPRDPVHAALAPIFAPYAGVSGTKLTLAVADGVASIIAAHADLALVDPAVLRAGCDAKQFIHLDWRQLDRSRYYGFGASDCGAGAYRAMVEPAWDHGKFAGVPSWGDFWDVARFPGRRGLPRGPRFTLEMALLADGAKPGEIYGLLGAPDGVARAFRKLDQLKPYIVWWDKPTEPGQLLAAGKVLFCAAPATLTVEAPAAWRPRLRTNPAMGLAENFSWAIPANAPHPDLAYLALFMAADPVRQAAFAKATGDGPSVPAALGILPAEAFASPSSAALLTQDSEFWAANQTALQARFQKWLAG